MLVHYRRAPLLPQAELLSGRVDPTEDDGVFQLSADKDDGTRFYLLAHVETAKLERYCKVIPLSELQRLENGDWVDVQSRKRLAPVRVTVDKSVRCG